MHRYRARVDFVPLLVLLVAVIMVDATAIGVAAPVFGPVPVWVPFGIFLSAASVPVLLGLFVVPVRYAINEGALQIRSGLLLRWRIPIVDIHRVLPVSNLYPSPALSTQRLRVDYQHGSQVRRLHIAPVHQQTLLRDLTAIDANLHLEDDALYRHGGPILLFDTFAS